MSDLTDKVYYWACRKYVEKLTAKIERLTAERNELFIKEQGSALEIERLRAEVSGLKVECDNWQHQNAKLQAVVKHCAVVRMCSKCAAALEGEDEAREKPPVA